MTDNTWNESVSQSVSQIAGSAAIKMAAVILRNGTPLLTMSNYEFYLEQTQRAKDILDNYDFVSDEDRKLAKSARALINKTAAEFNRQATIALSAYESEFKTQKETIIDQLHDLSASLADKIDAFDAKYKSDKLAEITENYETITRSRKIANLPLDDVFDVRWLNRSMPINKAVDAAIDRLEQIKTLLSLTTRNEIADERAAALILGKHEWDFGPAMKAIVESRAVTDANASASAPNEGEPLDAPSDSEIDASKTVSYVVTMPKSCAPEFETLMKLHENWRFNRI